MERRLCTPLPQKESRETGYQSKPKDFFRQCKTIVRLTFNTSCGRGRMIKWKHDGIRFVFGFMIEKLMLLSSSEDGTEDDR
jgi:hypothetical protein